MDILATTPSKSVALQFDVGTCVASGAEPVAGSRRTGADQEHALQDWKAGGKEYAVLFGEGDAPWAKIFAAAEHAAASRYLHLSRKRAPPMSS